MVAKRAVILIEGKHYNNLGICTLISLIYFSTIKKKKTKTKNGRQRITGVIYAGKIWKAS